jgi:MFS transporter, NNP family, nitrate/nitrite transporter
MARLLLWHCTTQPRAFTTSRRAALVFTDAERSLDRSFWRAGHFPTLLLAFLYFDGAFMAWTLLGPLAVQIAADLRLTPAEQSLMMSTPLLAGAVLRIAAGIMVDHLRPKLTGTISQITVLAVLAVAGLFGVHTFTQLMVLAVFLGVAGASFAVALPLASRWYPPQHQGLAMGIVGAGNFGSAMTAAFAPSLAAQFGWNAVFGLALWPLLLIFIAYLLIARDAPNAPPPKPLHHYLIVLKHLDAWWFMFFYFVTFGGFAGLAFSLTVYFNDQYGLDPVRAGLYTAVCVLAGSLIRPLGGMLADRIGGVRALLVFYTAAALSLSAASMQPADVRLALVTLALSMLWLGMGNGAVFQLVPQRFRTEIGVMTGLIGMAGSLGGFALAMGLGYSRQVTGDYRFGLAVFAALTLSAWIGLLSVKKRWRTTWGAAHVAKARV